MPDTKYRVMAINLLLLLLSGTVVIVSCVSIRTEATILLTNNDITKSLNRSSFPESFIFGTASSAYQVEGAANVGGRGPSIWDTFTHNNPEMINDRSNGDVAIDEYHIYKASQKGKIGITLVSYWIMALNDTELDHDAAQRAIDFMFGWFMDPLIVGDYPSSMRSLVGSRLPKFSAYQVNLVRGSFDFIGLNYYTSYYATNAPELSKGKPNYITDQLSILTKERNGIPIGPPAASSWLSIYPNGLRELLLYIKKKYNNPSIYITENGMDDLDDPTISLEKALEDTMRINYYYDHLYYLHTAIRDGVNVKGYFAWSLFDNFEWSSGYTLRFGVYFVDYNNNFNRYPKKSAIWFKSFLQYKVVTHSDSC
ncbi:hypothetical protein RYX36_009645 [Vicia faba]